MRRIPHILLIIIVAGPISSCGTKWSKERKAKFEVECSKTTLVDLSHHPIQFKGFALEDVDTVRIVERNIEQILDTFFIHGKENSNYPIQGESSALCTRSLDTRYSYDFYFGSDRYPYVLDSLKIGIHPEFKGMSEDYQCRLMNKRIDGEQMREFGNLVFNKKSGK